MKFRFETVLKINKDRENLIKREMGRINTHLQTQNDRLHFMEEIAEERKKELNEKMKGDLNVNLLMIYSNFFNGVRLEKERQEQVIAQVAEKLDLKKKDLVQAVMKRRTMEILKERDLKTFKKNQNKKEVELMDETGSNQWRLNS